MSSEPTGREQLKKNMAISEAKGEDNQGTNPTKAKALLKSLQKDDRKWVNQKQIVARTEYEIHETPPGFLYLHREGLVEHWGGPGSNIGLTERGENVDPGGLD